MDGSIPSVLPVRQLYAPDQLAAVQNSYLEIMLRYLISQASARGFEVIDLEKVFMADYRQRGLRFEFVNDYHWNETAHEVVAQAIGRSSVFSGIFGGRQPGSN